MLRFNIQLNDLIQRVRFLKNPKSLMRFRMHIGCDALLVKCHQKMVKPKRITVIILVLFFHKYENSSPMGISHRRAFNVRN